MSELRKNSSPPASLPLGFLMDGVRYEVADHPTRWWLRVLASQPPGCWWLVVPMGLRGRGRDQVVNRMLDREDELDLDDVEQAAEQVVGSVLGMNLWAGHRLAQMAYGNWMVFDGWCATHGFDPLTQPPGRVLSAVYAWRMSHCKKKTDASRVETQVWGPPPLKMASGRERDQAPVGWDDERESAAFMAALGTVKSKG